MKQWPSYEAISSISGWDVSVGEEIHHPGFGWHTCFHPSWSCADSPGASRRIDGPEFISHHPEINVCIWQQTLQSVRADGCREHNCTNTDATEIYRWLPTRMMHILLGLIWLCGISSSSEWIIMLCFKLHMFQRQFLELLLCSESIINVFFCLENGISYRKKQLIIIYYLLFSTFQYCVKSTSYYWKQMVEDSDIYIHS